MPDSRNKRIYDHETLGIPDLQIEHVEANLATSKSTQKRAARYEEMEKPDREKLVNKLIDHLKGL